MEFCEKSEKYNGEFSEEEIKHHLESIKDNLENGQIEPYAFDRAVADYEKFYDVWPQFVEKVKKDAKGITWYIIRVLREDPALEGGNTPHIFELDTGKEPFAGMIEM